jgi:exopolyphosphatase/guanosine-5'-triphosphate,3'-diphosphate pyrophosphatase
MFDADVRDVVDEDIALYLRVRARAPRRVAALDLGSRSFHLVVAELCGDDDFEIVAHTKERVFLGQSVFGSGEIDPDTFARGVAAVRRLRQMALEHTPAAITAVATAAVREASNGREFVRAVQQRAGIDVRVIDGLEEARLALLGARRELGAQSGRIALVDFGAGSTEVAVADTERCHLTASVPFGALRLQARLGRVNMLDPAQLARLQEQVAEDLGRAVAHVQLVGFDRLVLACGTARRILRQALAHRSQRAASAPDVDTELTRSDLARLQQLALDRGSALGAGLDHEQREELLLGATALLALLERMEVQSARVVSAGLREGTVADYLVRARSAMRAHEGLVSFATR